MKRRDVITLVGAATTWSFASRAQQLAMPVVGFLSGRSLSSDGHLVLAFRNGLAEAGYSDGRNAAVEFRWAEGKLEKLPELAVELLARQASVVFVGGADVGVREIKVALAKIPVVFATGGDPVALGIATSLARHGGNFTGMTVISASLWPKRLALLRELIGKPDLIAVLTDPANDTVAQATKDVETAAKAISQKVTVVNAKSETEFDQAFARIASERANGVIVPDDPVFINGRQKLTALAARFAVPTIYGRRDFVADGGLLSYGASTTDQYRQCGRYAGRILDGAKAGELPFLQPTKFELVLNVRAAKALGLKVPQTLLVTADEVIE